MPRSKKIYLAGPMTGLPEHNFPAFFAGEKILKARGWEVFNPAQNDIDMYGSLEGALENATYRECLKVDLSWICDHAQAIALLPGWENSKGVNAELALAQALGLEIIALEEKDFE